MGEVWLAEDTTLKRKVALKVLPAGVATDSDRLARFQREAEAVAALSHPNIVTIHSIERDGDVRFLTMERVEGQSLDQVIPRGGLPLGQVLEIGATLADALAASHEKGIIHRDLKPSNVLVTIQGDRPVPKIIDFGVAKATARHLTGHTLFTELGVMIGTPEYMSPEQAEMGALDIDTRTDVYALGVILYELLTGVLPFDRKALRQAGLAEIQRIIREQEPPRPSTRVTQVGPASAEAAKNRQTEPKRLVGQLRGDLDWITMKALEKDRTRRYDTVNGLANDVRRHLRNEPVVAGPPSAAYRAGKFVRRHRFGVGAAATLMLLLLAVGVAMALQAQRIARERDRAERVSAFLVSLFEASDPDRSKGDRLTARELLDTGAARLERELANEPGTRAALLHTIGRVYLRLSLYDAAERAFEQALQFRRTLAGRERLDLAATLHELGQVYRQQGDYGRAEAVAREALNLRRLLLGADHPDVGKTTHVLGDIAVLRGQLADAEALYKQALPLVERSDNPDDAAACLLALSGVYSRQNTSGAALETSRRALDLLRRRHGVKYSWTLHAMSYHAYNLSAIGEYVQAEQLQREYLATRREMVGDNHFDVGLGYYNLGNTLGRLDRVPEAEQALRESLVIWRRVLPAGHQQIGMALNDLAAMVAYQRRCAEAEPLYREALGVFQNSKDSDPSSAALSLYGLGEVYDCRGQVSEAEKHYRAALELRRKTIGTAHPLVAHVEEALGRLLTTRRAYEEAGRLLRDALEIRRKSVPSRPWDVGYTQALLGTCLTGEGRFGEAEPLLLEAYETLRAKFGEGSENARDAASGLEALYAAWGKPDRAAEWRKKLGPSKN